ncbi:MAG: hypothetical protein V4686_00050 [Patescibacteria group bacterium]
MKMLPKQTPVTKKRLRPFLTPSERLAHKLLQVIEVFTAWKLKPKNPSGCLNIGYEVRTNFHRIPTVLLSDIISALSGTEFEINRKGKFKQRRRERLWRDSIHTGEHIQTLPHSIDRTR